VSRSRAPLLGVQRLPPPSAADVGSRHLSADRASSVLAEVVAYDGGHCIVWRRAVTKFGFPTASVRVTPGMAVPADGVYAGWVTRLDVP
jgi:hypothetical protein